MNTKLIYASQEIDKSISSKAIQKLLRRLKFFLEAKRLEKLNKAIKKRNFS